MAFDAAAVAARISAGAETIGSGYPRDLALTAPLTMPISFILRPCLTTVDIAQTLYAATGRVGRKLSERRLRGCLIAHRGTGVIFLDEDCDALVRFAIAHELAHFIGHYLAKRELAVARLGANIIEVLDGTRAATAQERLAGILTGCPLGTFTDLMERDHGVPLSPSAELMEYEADEAAFLALAPVGMVIARTMEREDSIERNGIVSTLIEVFGLSAEDANRHAPRILNVVSRNKPSFVDQLREAASEMMRERHTNPEKGAR